MSGAALAEAALALVGTRFRLHGRDPATGVDCIGLLEVSLGRIGRPVALPQGYRLRLTSLAHWLPDPAALGFAICHDAIALGDVLLFAPGPGQFHLAIAVQAGGYVHAHAGLRRVVVTAGPLDGIVQQHWRLLSE